MITMDGITNDYIKRRIKKLEYFKIFLKVNITLLIICIFMAIFIPIFLALEFILIMLLIASGLTYSDNYLALNSSIKKLNKKYLDYRSVVYDINSKPFKANMFLGSKAMYYGGAFVEYKDVVWTYGKNTVTTTRFYGMKVGDNTSKTMVIKLNTGENLEEVLSVEEWKWLIFTYRNMFSKDLLIGYDPIQEIKYKNIRNEYKNSNSINGVIDLNGESASDKKKSRAHKRFWIILGVCLLLIAQVLAFKNFNDYINKSDNETEETVKSKSISYDGKNIGTVSEEKIGNNISIYRLDYVNLKNYNVKIRFEFESGYLNKKIKFTADGALSFADSKSVMGVVECSTLDVEYINKYGVEKFFEMSAQSMKDDGVDGVRLEKSGDKYLIYYKETSFNEGVANQYVIICDMKEEFVVEFGYAVDGVDEVDEEIFEHFIETVELDD